MHSNLRYLAAVLLATSVSAFAQAPGTTFADAPEPPDLPEPVRSGEPLDEPQVTIVRGEKETVYEYRVNGELRAMRVVPDNAPAYYLVDADGDGNTDILFTSERGLDSDGNGSISLTIGATSATVSRNLLGLISVCSNANLGYSSCGS